MKLIGIIVYYITIDNDESTYRKVKEMPEISRFLGIIITMYYKDHDPPHFHVKYGEYRAVFSIIDLKLTQGTLPNRIISLVLEWAFLHRDELLEDWTLALEEKPLKYIEPLV